MSIKNLKNKIVLKVPKVDNFHSFLMKFLADLDFSLEKKLDFDILFNEIWDEYLSVDSKDYEIGLFVDEKYVFIVMRFPKGKRQDLWKIINDNFFFPDEETKDAIIKIEAD